MKVLLIPLTILIGILIITGIILNTSSPISIPSFNSKGEKSDTSVKGAVWKSIDGGTSFEPRSKVIEGTPINLSRNVIQLTHGNNNNVLALTRTGGVFRTTNFGDDWRILLNSSITTTTIGNNPNNADEIYLGGIDSKRARLYRTMNSGKDNKWQEVYTEPKSGTSFVSIQVDPKNNDIIYALLSSGVLLKSYNKGQDWVLASNMKTTVIGLTIDKDNPEIILVAATTKLLVSIDGGFTFEESKPKLRLQAVTGAQITSFAVNPNNSQEIYLGSSGELLRTQDRGKTWENLPILTPNLSLPISNIGISASNPNNIYYTVGTVLYRSSDQGDSWNTSDLSTIVKSVTTLLIDKEKSDILYIGTN